MITGAILAVAALLYAAAWWRVRGTEHRIAVWRALCFAVAELTVASALLSPLAGLAQVSLTLHVLQVALLMAVGAPLFVLAQPLRGLVRGRTPAPWIGWFAPALALVAWHLPAAVEATRGAPGLRVAAHATLLLAAMVFWSVLIRGWEGRMTFTTANIFVASTAGYLLLFGGLLFLAPVVLYPGYDRPSTFGMSALEDQGLAGVVLWMPALAVLALCAIAGVMSAMKKAQPARVARRAAPRDV